MFLGKVELDITHLSEICVLEYISVFDGEFIYFIMTSEEDFNFQAIMGVLDYIETGVDYKNTYLNKIIAGDGLYK
jgi:hypothetical protein